jgi:hypothetical protein
MVIGGDFIELIEAGGVNGTKLFDGIEVSLGKGCSTDLIGVTVTDDGIIFGKQFVTVGCVKLLWL